MRRLSDESRLSLALFGVGWGANQFTPLLVVYRTRFGLSAAMLGALFGCYALGLIPGLLAGGPLSDARGRKPVVLPFLVVSVLATGILIAGSVWEPALAIGRVIAGLVSGVVFGAGSAWLLETSPSRNPKRAALAVTAGFCLGPLVAGVVADVLPWPTIVPYLPHLVLMAVALPGAFAARETGVVGARHHRTPPSPDVRRLFRRRIIPLAPFVFASVGVTVVVLPTRFPSLPHPVTVVGLMNGITLGAGALIQRLGRRLEGAAPGRAAQAGLLCAVLGWALAGWTAAQPTIAGVVLTMLLMGAAYGLCLVGGMAEVGRMASDVTRGTLVGWFYAWAYVGFGAPFLVSWAGHHLGVPQALLVGSAVAVLSLLIRQGGAPSTVRELPHPVVPSRPPGGL
jgi:MFS family permease